MILDISQKLTDFMSFYDVNTFFAIKSPYK
jgi:hypothetical protein